MRSFLEAHASKRRLIQNESDGKYLQWSKRLVTGLLLGIAFLSVSRFSLRGAEAKLVEFARGQSSQSTVIDFATDSRLITSGYTGASWRSDLGGTNGSEG